MKKILLSLIISLFIFTWVNAWVNLWGEWESISDVSLKSSKFTQWWGDIVDNVESLWISLLTTVKVIFEWVLIIYIVYIWITFILSMWTNEEDLSKAKRSIRYSMIWLLFINVPWTIYNIFNNENLWDVGSSPGSWAWDSSSMDSNILVNMFYFKDILNWEYDWGIIGFLEVAISAFAIIMIVIEWIKIMTSRWREERVTQAKTRILWSIIWLVFIGFIDAWRNIVFYWDLDEWGDLFESMTDIALFFALPTAIAFLTMAAYYYITANGDEERIKKAKSIVINTLIATVLLLASYTFLLDISEFSFNSQN